MGKKALQGYCKKRNFAVTREPAVRQQNKSAAPIWVIQKHAASNLHYDLRLEVDGVLKSWAVPKGPSSDPREKRLALPKEDHPLDYAQFEGKIPEDQYGGGTVLIWDAGTYRNLKQENGDSGRPPQSMTEAYDAGHINVFLEAGEKISGGYALIRTDSGDDERWLLVKMDDEAADARRNPVSTEPDSVATGRSIEEIADEVVREEPA